MRKPDFFMVGAPKAGTTSIQHYLDDHPDIFIPRYEIHFFGNDLNPRIASWIPRPTEEQYLALFAGRNESRLGEKSAAYLYSQRAAKEIRAFQPAARIVVTLRNPIDIIYSLHNQFVYDGVEDIADFSGAMRIEEERRRGTPVRTNGEWLGTHIYKGIANFAPQVKRYLETFGREKVHFVIYDDLKEDTPKTFKALLRFLDVDDNFQPEYRVHNPRKRRRTQLQTSTLRRLPPQVRELLRSVVPRPCRRWAWMAISRLNTVYVRPTPMNTELRQELQNEFRPQVEELSKLLDRDLTHWVAS